MSSFTSAIRTDGAVSHCHAWHALGLSDRPEGDPERCDDAYATRSTTSKHHNPPRRSVPFRDESIDAATSSDVLCGLVDKVSVLRTSHRIVKPGGVLCFAVISHADGLRDDETATAFEAGPDHPDAGPGYPSLMPPPGSTTWTLPT